MRIDEYSERLAKLYELVHWLKAQAENLPRECWYEDRQFWSGTIEPSDYLDYASTAKSELVELNRHAELQRAVRRHFVNGAETGAPGTFGSWHDAACRFAERVTSAIDQCTSFDLIGLPESIDADRVRETLSAIEFPEKDPEAMRNHLLREAASMPRTMSGPMDPRRERAILEALIARQSQLDEEQEEDPLTGSEDRAMALAETKEPDVEKWQEGEINQKMCAILFGSGSEVNHDCLEWSQRKWASEIGCSPGSIPNQKTYHLIKKFQAMSRSERQEKMATYCDS